MDKRFRTGRAGWGSMLVRLVAYSLLGYGVLAPSAYAKQRLQVGDTPPDSLGKAANGSKVNLTDYRGKIVIISFFASWCAPCRKELPVLEAIQKNGTHDKIAVFAVNWRESYEQYRAIVKSLKDISLTLVSDESGHLGNEYDVKAIPHMIIIGRDGRIAAVHVGYGESEIPTLVKEINSLWTASGPTPTSDTTPESPATEPKAESPHSE